MDTIKVIAKKYVDEDFYHIEEARTEDGYVELFFPEYSVNDGMIVVWDGNHSEASLEYFNEGEVVPLPPKLKKIYEQQYDCELVEVSLCL